ncbi:MAG: hypothetical protein A2W30_09065 [Ignavibacteria bacterium RBG_16_36_9]|nr:MAG: hypothetical protein A2W30_09065 [Ignavibacteria bacterium RBG_16_36_9]
MSQSLTDKTISGLNWNFVNTYSSAIISTIIGVILARLLTPKDFGLIGMVVVFTGLAELFATLGLGKSIIRMKNINEDHITTATIVTVCSSILIFLVFYFTAPAIAGFYNEPKLISILRALAVLFILQGISTVSYSQIMRELDFKTITIIHIFTSIVYGTVSASLALINFGVWSLVLGKISSQFLGLILSVYKFPAKLKPSIRKKEFKELIGFGSGVSLSNILFYGTTNIDYLLIGKFLNPQALGLYTRAFNFVTQTMGQITAGTQIVLFPAFSAVQDNKEKLRRAYLRTVQTVSYILFPVLFSMVVVSDYIVKGLYGTKWVGTIPSLKILLLAGVLRVTLQYSGSIAHATGKVYSEVIRQLFYFLILAGCALYLIRFGIEGVAFAVLIARIWMFIALSQLAIKIINSSWKEFFKAHIPAVANSILMVLLNLILVFTIENVVSIPSNEIKLLIIVLLNIPFFLATIVFMPLSIKGDTFDWLLDKYKKYIPSKFLQFYLAFNSQK